MQIYIDTCLMVSPYSDVKGGGHQKKKKKIRQAGDDLGGVQLQLGLDFTFFFF